MKRNRLITLGCLIICLMILACGCEKEPDHKKTGESWAYVHEPAAEILWLGDNGKATFKDKSYDYVKDDEFITLTDENKQTLKMHYSMNKGQMLLYEINEYHFVASEGIGEPDGLVGTWKGGEEDRSSFQFTEEGIFMEDEFFPGHYTVDEKNGTVKLMYEDHFADTVFYFHLDGEKLTIEYPWPMVKTDFEKKDSAKE